MEPLRIEMLLQALDGTGFLRGRAVSYVVDVPPAGDPPRHAGPRVVECLRLAPNVLARRIRRKRAKFWGAIPELVETICLSAHVIWTGRNPAARTSRVASERSATVWAGLHESERECGRGLAALTVGMIDAIVAAVAEVEREREIDMQRERGGKGPAVPPVVATVPPGTVGTKRVEKPAAKGESRPPRTHGRRPGDGGNRVES